VTDSRATRTAGVNPKRLMAAVSTRVKRDVGRGFSAFLRSVVNRASDGSGLDLGDDAEVLRFLRRLGVPEAGGRGKHIATFVAELSRASGLEPVAVGLYLRIYAAGEPGLKTEAICGEMPRCAGCELAESCAFRRDEIANPSPARAERPGDRLQREGEEALTATELISMILSGKGLGPDRALGVARRLLEESSLRELATRPLAEVTAVEGMTPELALRLRSALALARRWTAERRAEGRQFRAGMDFFEFFGAELRDLKKETFFVVLLDQKNRYIGHERVSTGTLTGAPVHPREVFRPAIREAAAAVAFVHNHPSGSPEPSRDDREITARLLEVAKLVGVRVLDHVIVGEERFFSFVEEGLI
jgi:DNA repair protein RadC